MHFIRQMGHIVFSTPDPGGSARDLSEIIGLHVTAQDDRSVQLTSNERGFEVVYVKGDQPGVLSIGLEAMDAASVAEVARRAFSEGLEVLSDRPLLPQIAKAVRFRTPFGPILEVHTSIPKRAPGQATSSMRSIKRLEHVNLHVTDTHGFRDLLTSMLGMKISDKTTNDEFMWFRAADRYHHTIAAGRGAGLLQHYTFDAESLQTLADVADALSVRDRSLIWGIGRHGPGNNLFAYYRDPNGCAVEVSSGGVRIEDDEGHEPTVWALGPGSRTRNLWGPGPDPAYGACGLPFVAEP